MAEKSKKSFIDQIYDEIGESDMHQGVSDYLSTGYLPLNKAISGVYAGGFPVGRISEVYGKESSGKTLLATMACVETQSKKGLAVYLDHEHAFELEFAKKLGLKNDKDLWVYKQPVTAEDTFKIIDFIVTLATKDAPDKYITVIVDSVASMIPKYEFDMGAGESNMKSKLALASVMSSELKKLAAVIGGTNVTVIFLNQVRENPGVMFGSPEKTTGGNALKFYASLRVQLRKSGTVKDGEGQDATIVGENVVATIIKNKIWQPFKTANYVTDLARGGINLCSSHIDALIKDKIIVQSGAWFEYNGAKVQGKGKLIELVKDPTEYAKMLTLFKD